MSGKRNGVFSELIGPIGETDATCLEDLLLVIAKNIELSMLAAGATPVVDYTYLDLFELAAPFALSVFEKSDKITFVINNFWEITPRDNLERSWQKGSLAKQEPRQVSLDIVLIPKRAFSWARFGLGIGLDWLSRLPVASLQRPGIMMEAGGLLSGFSLALE